jgi:cysteine desulfurase
VNHAEAIYCDNAATTYLAPEVAQVLTAAFSQSWGNPASQHSAGRFARTTLEDAKDHVKSLCLGTSATGELDSWQVLLTSGGTEANNLAVRGLTAAANTPLLLSAVEHPSILALATECPLIRSRCSHLSVDSLGQVDSDALNSWCRSLPSASQPALVCVMVGNNETGILSDLPAISRICRAHKVLLHADAVQAFGKVDPLAWVPWVDSFSISAHKVHGPIGIGALLLRSTCQLQPILFGGGQQLGLRPGSESVPLALGLAEACRLAEQQRLDGAMQHVATVRDLFESRLLAADIGVQILGANTRRLPHICLASFPGLDRQALLMALDMAGVLCSSGSACASGSSQPSHVLAAMRVPPLWVNGALRFSFSNYTGGEAVEDATERISRVVKKQLNRAR